jgi:hypothetical protein
VPLPDRLARINRRVTNPIMRTFAGGVPGLPSWCTAGGAPVTSTARRQRVSNNYPTRPERTPRWMDMHTLHEVRHHLPDVSPQL